MRLDERRRGLMLVLLGQGRSCHSIARVWEGFDSTSSGFLDEAFSRIVGCVASSP